VAEWPTRLNVETMFSGLEWLVDADKSWMTVFSLIDSEDACD